MRIRRTWRPIPITQAFGVAEGSANGGLSDFGVATTGITMESSFVESLFVNDLVNASDTNGASDYSSITDWLNFENEIPGMGQERHHRRRGR